MTAQHFCRLHEDARTEAGHLGCPAPSSNDRLAHGGTATYQSHEKSPYRARAIRACGCQRDKPGLEVIHFVLTIVGERELGPSDLRNITMRRNRLPNEKASPLLNTPSLQNQAAVDRNAAGQSVPALVRLPCCVTILRQTRKAASAERDTAADSFSTR